MIAARIYSVQLHQDLFYDCILYDECNKVNVSTVGSSLGGSSIDNVRGLGLDQRGRTKFVPTLHTRVIGHYRSPISRGACQAKGTRQKTSGRRGKLTTVATHSLCAQTSHVFVALSYPLTIGYTIQTGICVYRHRFVNERLFKIKYTIQSHLHNVT